MSPTPPPNRRRVQRLGQPSFSIVQFRTAAAQQPVLAQVRDQSVEGLGLLTEDRIDLGTVLEIQFPGGRSRAGQVLFAEVRHAAIQDDGRWYLGCVFSRKLALDDLITLD